MAQSVKCVVVGDGAVGKTCMLSAFSSNKFPVEYIPTVFDNCSRTMMVDGRGVVLNIWDTAGQEDYDRMRFISYPGTDIFLVCFSLDSEISYENVKTKWIPELRTHANKVPFILVGLKSDLRDGTASKSAFISQERGEHLKNEIKASKYVECSAKTQQGIRQVFEEGVRVVFLGINSRKKSACLLV